jgi:photosynthetic reaction center H subunit
MNFARIKKDRVVIRSLYAANVGGIPTIKSDSEVTLLEEEKVMAYFGGGTMYADKSREEPLL